MDDILELRPTIFCSVPRLYNRIYAGIINAVKTSGGLKEKLFNVAYNSKKHAIMNGRNPSPIWEKLVFNKIKAKVGRRVRFMGSGASPLSPDVLDFLKVCFGCQVVEGHGMTETSCVITSMEEGDLLSGHVGCPNPACEVKLVDVPEMNYTSKDQPYPRGEISVRGPIVFKGHFKDEVQTREVIDDDGWLHTGDIGLWLPGGRLKIIDSSYGQNLDTTTYMGETSFAILIAILGLVLFAHLIGNMQTYLQSITVRLEEWRLKRRDTEEWMRHRQLPEDLRQWVRRFNQYKWLATRGVDEESILTSLPANSNIPNSQVQGDGIKVIGSLLGIQHTQQLQEGPGLA